MREFYDDKFVSVAAADVSADNTNGNEVSAAEFEVGSCNAPVVIANVSALGNDKTIALKLQHRDSATASWVDVPAGRQTNANPDDDIDSTGIYQRSYAGQLSRFRLVVVSTSANPAATVKVVYQRHRLWEKPNNKSLA